MQAPNHWVISTHCAFV